MIHGELRIKTFPVNNGKDICKKPVRVCVLHGEIEQCYFHLHLTCDNQPKPSYGASVEPVKAMRKAA